MNHRQYRRKQLILVCFLTGLIILVLLRHATGQSLSPENLYTRSYFLNVSSGLGGSGHATLAETNFQFSKKGMLSLGLDFTSGRSEYPFSFRPNTTDAMSLYVAYGGIEKSRNTLFIWSVGLANTNLEQHGNEYTLYIFSIPYQTCDLKEVTVTSFRLQGKVLFAGSFAGVSLTGFVNINSNYSYGGITLGLALGKVNFKRN